MTAPKTLRDLILSRVERGMPPPKPPASLAQPLTFTLAIPPDNAKLCYVEGNCAYFTDRPLTKQWGDDWDDAPYEHNAGHPYRHEGEQIFELRYDSCLQTPGELATSNSAFSVRDINRRITPWLAPDRWYSGPPVEPIWAGCSITEFCDLIYQAQGEIFWPTLQVQSKQDS